MKNIIENKLFFNFRCKNEMSFIKRTIWVVFGERIENTADGYYVRAYRFMNITLITKCEAVICSKNQNATSGFMGGCFD